ncbi:MAG TPA: DegT/DnrJ/EryC1/StrS family aminotransferase [Spirochaetota bacterium]|nr:DegT/DnrJ/EryC1/StrS family aminotransferase [Spirochaetota bacterium]HNT11668.1 DegT/DnrJ/EryC1/StrS family aminotransferase [Spirochaetota bacterium]
MKNDFIPVCEPFLNGNELEYVIDTVKTGWISSSGTYVDRFEKEFAAYCGAHHAVAVCNGTIALHLAVVALGIGKGDEVIIPNFTMAASAFAICYTGAVPTFVDADPFTWNMDPDLIEAKISPRTKAIMAVSIFGHPCEMDAINRIAKKHGLRVIEDAAESFGAEYRGTRTGALAEVTGFSFFANKNITTGEGGMVTTNDDGIHDQLRYYRNMCFPLNGPRNYRHDDIGFNYRLSNLIAAVGLAQVEKADEYVGLRIRNGSWYQEHLRDIPGITTQGTLDHVKHPRWMNGILVDPERYGRSRDELMAHLAANGIETRLFFVGMHRQPFAVKHGCDVTGAYPVTENLTANGMYLPSASSLSEETIRRIAGVIAAFRGDRR